MILTILPNPSLDKVSIVPGFHAGGAFHAERVQWFAGGKGSHFARVLHALGEEALLVGPLGGYTGRLVADLAQAEGLRSDFLWIEGATRTGLVVFDPESQQITELYEPGPALSPGEWDQVAEKITAHLPEAEMTAVCGSFPKDAPGELLAKLVRQSQEANVPILLDTYGPLVQPALEAHPDVIKINQQEASDLLAQPITSLDEARDGAREIQKRGAKSVILTLGSQGAVGVGAGGEIFTWASPVVESLFPVGSGDSFFAGLVFGLRNGMPFDQAARMGAAAGAANTLQVGPGVLEKERVYDLYGQIQPL